MKVESHDNFHVRFYSKPSVASQFFSCTTIVIEISQKMLNFLIFFLLIFNSSQFLISAPLQPVQNLKSNLSKFVCDTIDKISHHDIQRIAIAKLRNNFSSTFFDELYKCMPVNITLVQFDLRDKNLTRKWRRTKFAVVIADDVDWVNMNLLMKRN